MGKVRSIDSKALRVITITRTVLRDLRGQQEANALHAMKGNSSGPASVQPDNPWCMVPTACRGTVTLI
jgi:hypothetical protein